MRVDLSEADVLNDDVLGAVDHADTLSLDNTLVALSDQGLVGANSDTKDTSLVIGDAADLGCVLLVVVTPAVLVDGDLASRASAPGTATSRGDLALGTGEVKSLGEDNGTSLRVSEVADQLGSGLGVDRRSVATTSDACAMMSIRFGRSTKADIPLAKPSAAPLTASAALTVVAKAAAMATKNEHFMVEFLLVEKQNEWIANTVC